MSDNGEVGIKTPVGTLYAKGKIFRIEHLIMILALIIISGHAVMAYVEWNDGKLAMKELQNLQKETTNAQYEMNYIITLPQGKRESLNLAMPESLRAKIRRKDE